MAEFTSTVVTDAGRALLARTQTGGTINLTKAATGAGIYSVGEDIAKLEELKDKRQTFDLISKKIIDDAAVQVRFVATNDPQGGVPLDEGYNLTEIGIYATDGENEILYALAVTSKDKSDYMPAYDGGAPTTVTVNMQTAVSGNLNIEITVPEGAYATIEDLTDAEVKIAANAADLENLEAAVTDGLNSKVDKTQMVQATGTSTTSIMSQKAVTDALDAKVDKTQIVQTTGQNTDKIVSQKVVTDGLNGAKAIMSALSGDKGAENSAYNLPADGWWLCDDNIPKQMFGNSNSYCYVLQTSYSNDRKAQIAVPYARYGADGRTMAFRVRITDGWTNWTNLISEDNIDSWLSTNLRMLIAENNILTKFPFASNCYLWLYENSGMIGIQATSIDARLPTNKNSGVPITAGAYTTISTRKSKTAIEEIGLDRAKKLLKLQPIEYEVKDDDTHKKHYGMIAEEVDEIDSVPVTRGEDGEIIGLDYQSFIAPLIKLIQEQEKRIEKLESKLYSLESDNK